MKGKKTHAILAATALLVVALACGPRQATPVLILTAGPQAGEASPTPTLPPPPTTGPPPATDTPAATDTPVPDVTAESGCTLNASWVADVTVPDDTVFPPSAAFVKTWRVRNSGTCDWEPGTKLVYVSGDPLSGPTDVPVGALAAGSNTDISVNLVAPTAPGTYKSNWQMQDPQGTHYGSVIYAKIVVPSPATNTPVPTNPPVPTAIPTPTETLPPPCVAPHATLLPVLNHANGLGYDLGCPTAPAFTVQGAFQEFWTNIHEINPHLHYRSLMIWRSDNREIYVIDGKNTDASEGMLLAYTDFWEEGQPDVHPDCAAMTVPSGYLMPVRGFGRIWCTQHLEDEVGWPSWRELQVNLLIQPMQTGLLMKVSNPETTSYLVALDYQAVYAVTMFTSP